MRERDWHCLCIPASMSAFGRFTAFVFQDVIHKGYVIALAHDQISTFDAYRYMGLKKDHRCYDDVADVCFLLGIKAPFIVLTNNPDKISSLAAHGMEVAGTAALEFEPSPFNVAYLASKADSGHVLTQAPAPNVKGALPPEPEVIGPACGFGAARRFVAAVLGSRLGPASDLIEGLECSSRRGLSLSSCLCRLRWMPRRWRSNSSSTESLPNSPGNSGSTRSTGPARGWTDRCTNFQETTDESPYPPCSGSL